MLANTKVNEINLSQEKYDLKKYASFGLIDFSEHAKQRMHERGISSFDIFEFLRERNASIVQYKKAGSYHNQNPRFVVCTKHDKKILHIVIEKEKLGSATHYKVITVYEPDKRYFTHQGRVLKKAKDRV